MKVNEFLRLAAQPGRLNLLAICSDELGLPLLLPRALAGSTLAEDLTVYDAEGLTKERAREIEAEARTAPRGGSSLQTVFIHRLQKLPAESVGPLLKATEDARWTRFIFQAQSVPRKIRTLASRASVTKLPFLSKAAVLANLKALSFDAKAADELNLWDGTLAGTIRNLRAKDALTAIRRELSKGSRGLAALFFCDQDTNSGYLTSSAFRPALEPHLTPAETAFLRDEKRGTALSRRKIVTYLALTRAGG